MGFASQVDDDGTALRALAWARWAVRDFVDRSDTPMREGNPGWADPSDAHNAIGELIGLAKELPQAVARINHALHEQLRRAQLTIGYGSRYEGNPRAAVEAAGIALDQASDAARRVEQALTSAHEATQTAATSGPQR